MRNLISLALLAALAGCGHLGVKMSVLNPAYVTTAEEQAGLQKQLKDALGQEDRDVDEQTAARLESHRVFYEMLASEYLADAAGLSGQARTTLEEIANALLPDFDSFIVPEHQATSATIRKLNTDVRAAYLELEQPVDILDGRLAWLLRQRLAETIRFAEFVERDTDQALSDAVTQRMEPSEGVLIAKQNAEDRARSPLGSNLQSSPFAYAVANAEDEHWSKNLLNGAAGRGRLGNLNVAIRLGGDGDVFSGDFTIKGLTFDPSEVAAVASKAATQAVLLAAQISGVPVTTSSTQPPAGAGAALATSSNRLATLEAEAAQNEALMADFESALFLIGEAVLADNARWRDSSSTVRAASLEAIEATYNAHKPRLDLSRMK